MKFTLCTDRLSELRKYASKENLSIEIGPNYKPILPKKEGYKAFVVDVYSTEELRHRAKNDPSICDYVSDIEEVDIIYNNSLLESVNATAYLNINLPSPPLESFDLIISSHNFEHIPNPIQFLLDCQALLSAKGVLTMAIPIGTRVFDRLRPISTTGNFLDAYYENHAKPTIGQIFDNHMTHAYLKEKSQADFGKMMFSSSEDIALFGVEDRWNQNLFSAMIAQQQTGYVDAHCWVMNPNSFVLIMSDLNKIGLLASLHISELVVAGDEFIVHLTKQNSPMVPYLNSGRKDLAVDAAYFQAEETINLKNQETNKSV